jgi:hypothetical protein
MKPLLRNLHLYAGLFASPLVVLFSISVLLLVHAWIPGAGAERTSRRVENLAIPPGLEQAKGRDQIAAVRGVLGQLGVGGEVGFVRHFPAERRLTVAVLLPGADTNVEIDLAARTALVAARTTGAWDATVFLHKMPGPHNVNIRGNSVFMQVWRILADATVGLILFLTLSGLYLWAALRAERRTGLAFLGAGAASLATLVYALVG